MSRPSGLLIVSAAALLASLGLSLLLACGMDAAAEPAADVRATEAAVKACLTGPPLWLRLPANVPPARVVLVAQSDIPQTGFDAGGNPVPMHCAPECTGYTDFATDTTLVSNWTPLAHELVHYFLDQAGLEWTLNAAHQHPGFEACGGAAWVVWA